MLHFITTRSGITLKASPAWIAVIETTAGSSGSITRETMVCAAVTIAAAATIGSRARCGKAAWPPPPSTVMWNLPVDAIAGPRTTPNEPTGTPGQLCTA